jgi:hypothetical protein
MDFLEFIITWFFADHLASKQEEAREDIGLSKKLKS